MSAILEKYGGISGWEVVDCWSDWGEDSGLVRGVLVPLSARVGYIRTTNEQHSRKKAVDVGDVRG